MRILLLVISILTVGSVTAAEEKFTFDTVQKRELFLELSDELRCPKCQNQNIADSNATVAKDMKRKVHTLVTQGQDKKQVIAYMKQRYGDFVHYQPPVTPATLMLWILPVLIPLFAIIYLLRGGKKEEIAASTLEHADALLNENTSDTDGGKS